MISLGSAYGEIQIGVGDAMQNVQGLADTMKKVGGTLTMGISAPLLAVGGAALKSAGDFEQSMNQMQVVSGATDQAMASLQATALRLGAETSFSAGEAADGMLELAKAGLDAMEVQAAIPGVLDLAAAGNLGIAQAAEIAANALNAFQLPAEDASRVANLLAATANASSVEVTDLAYAFQMSSSVFAANGQSIEELSTAIAILGNNGLKGSDAGTSMKTMLMRLTAPTAKAAGVMEDLGLQVYNADGSMRPFSAILQDLTGITAKMSDEQRNAAFSTIFGADAIRAATILTKSGTEEWNAMAAAVNKQGAAAEVAGARMKGFNGAIEYMKGSIDSFLIGAALPFLNMFGDLIRRVADGITAFGNLPEPVKNSALAFAAVLAVSGPIIMAIGGIISVLGALLSPIGLVVLAVATLAAAWAGDWWGIREVTMQVWSTLQDVFGQIAAIGSDVYSAVAWIFEGKADNIDWWGDITDGLVQLGIVSQETGDKLAEWLFNAGVAAGEMVQSIKTSVADVWQSVQAFIAGDISLGGLASALATGLANIASAVLGFFGAANFGELIQVLNWDKYIEMLSWDNFLTLMSDWSEWITSLDWTAIVVQMLDWASWIPALLWNAFVTELEWAAWAVKLVWSQFITQIDWMGFITRLTTWGSYVSEVDWGDHITKFEKWASYVVGIAWKDFVDKLIWPKIPGFEWKDWAVKLQWPDLSFAWSSWIDKLVWPNISWPGFGTFVDRLNWPDIRWPGFGTFVDRLNWPSISWPGWGDFIPDFPGWPNLGDMFRDWLSNINLPGFAIGSSGVAGGVAKVGERGAEYVVMPPGARVLTNGQSNRLEGQGGKTIHLHLDGVVINRAVDEEELFARWGQRLSMAVG